MGYRIVYCKENKETHSLLRMQGLIAAFLLIFALCVRLTWPEGQEILRSLLVSDGLSAQAEAVVSLLESMEEGESFSQTITVFCQEIMGDG